jgi:hypothetical protein
MGVGYDAVTATAHPSPIVSLSFNHQNTYLDPLTGITYLYPDQVSRPTKTPNPPASVNVYRNLTSVAVEESSGMHFFVPILFTPATLSYSVQNSYKSFAAQLSVRSQKVEDINMWTLSFDTADVTQFSTSAFFNASVHALPDTYDKEKYGLFVATFGTHVIAQTVVGGRSSLWVDVDMSYYSSSTSSQTDLTIKDQTTGLYADMTEGTFSSTSDFNSRAFGEMLVRGGNAATSPLGGVGSASASRYNDWIDSIANLPVPLQVNLVDIADFVSDPIKSAYVQQAVTEYMSFYQIADETVTNVNVRVDQSARYEYPSHGGGCPADTVYNNGALIYRDGNLGEQWVTDNTYNSQLTCRSFYVESDGVSVSGTPFMSAPYLCDRYDASMSCGDGVVLGSTIAKKDHCGDFNDCYYYNGDLVCARLCVDNKFRDTTPMGYWWSQ